MDDAVCAQLQSLQAAHQAELLQMANDKHNRIEEANQKVKPQMISLFSSNPDFGGFDY